MMRSQNNGVRSSNLNAGNQGTCWDWCCGFMGWSSNDTEVDLPQQSSLSAPASNYVNANGRNSLLDGVQSSNYVNANGRNSLLDGVQSSSYVNANGRNSLLDGVQSSNYVNATSRNSLLDGAQSFNNLLVDNAQVAEAPNFSAPAKMVNPGQYNMVGEGGGQAKIASAPLKEVHNPQPAGGGSNSVSVGQQLDNIGGQTDNAGQVLQQDDSSSSQGPAAFDLYDY